MHLSYAYMEMRHYSDAVDCMDEAIEIAEDKVPDLYFRRSQARAYNNYSNEEELEKAMADIDKAISLKDDPMYREHKKFIEEFIAKKFSDEVDRAKSNIFNNLELLAKVKKNYEKIKSRNINVDEVVFVRDEDSKTQYKILKE
jgi:tetratricopeptide (TPR) repeat protein